MMNDEERRLLNPRPMKLLQATNRPGGTNKPGGTNRPGGTNKPGGTNRPPANRPSEADQPSNEEGGQEDDGLAQTVLLTERLKAGYSTERNDQLGNLLEKRKEHGWEAIGPDNLGGRVTCLIAKPGVDRNHLLAGAACGGLWDGAVTETKTSTGKTILQCRWEENPPGAKRTNDTFLMHNIGALALDERTNTIYCGTGHAYYAGDSFPGAGLFRSEDDGKTWARLGSTTENFPRRVSTIAVDHNHVWVGGVVFPQEDDSGDTLYSGIYHSADKGKTWERVLFTLKNAFAEKSSLSTGLTSKEGIFKELAYQCHSIVFLGATVVLAAITAPLNWGGIWRSEDGGKTWEQLTRGLPLPREFGRTSLAVAKSNQSAVYAFIGAADGRCLGVYRSCDRGEHWVGRGSKHFAGVSNLNYVNCLAVSPTDADVVVCGARDLHRSVDGGQTWTQATEWFAAPDSSTYAHADHHALLWPARGPLYSANDGGVDASQDDGITWRNLTKGLGIAMFYDIDVASIGKTCEDLIVAGGTQDNATVITDFRASGIGYVPSCLGLQFGLTKDMADGAKVQLNAKSVGIINFDDSGMTDLALTPVVHLFTPQRTSSSTHASSGKNNKPARNFVDILYGDGGWIVFDPHDALHLYGSSQNMTIYRHRRDNGWQEVTPDATDEERNRVWMAILAMHPTDPNVVFTGSTRVWRTTNDGADWLPVSAELDGSPISAIEIANSDSNYIYVGTVNGNMFRSTDGGNRWTDNPGENKPKPMEWRKDLKERPTIGVARTITRIEAHPHHADKVAVTLMGFDQKYRLPHVLWFDGKKWIDFGDNHSDKRSDSKDSRCTNSLPNVHHNVLTWDKSGGHLFVGNDIGVWVLDMNQYFKSPDTCHWRDISANLPNAIVTDLVYHDCANSLIAATYGRSLWLARLKDVDAMMSKEK